MMNGTGKGIGKIQLDPAYSNSKSSLIISNSKPFPLDLAFCYLQSAILNSRNFERLFVFPESSE